MRCWGASEYSRASTAGSPSSSSTATSASVEVGFSDAGCSDAGRAAVGPEAVRASSMSAIIAVTSAVTSGRMASGTRRDTAWTYRSVSERMSGVLPESGEARGEGEPFGAEVVRDPGPRIRERVVLARAGLVRVPLRGQQTLLVEPAQQGIERVRLDLDPRTGERVQQRVAVLRHPAGGEAGEHHRAAAHLLQVQGEGVCGVSGNHGKHDTVSRTV